jgi:hypothetical protein
MRLNKQVFDLAGIAGDVLRGMIKFVEQVAAGIARLVRARGAAGHDDARPAPYHGGPVRGPGRIVDGVLTA